MRVLNRLLLKIKREGILNTAFALFTYPFTIKQRIQYRSILGQKNTVDRFNAIYEKNVWASKESKSGTGSELGYTQSLRQWLIKKIPELQVKVFVDAPCGDFNWMREVLPHINVNYIGLDIVAPLIESNRGKYSSDAISFDVANICEDVLPDCDLLMVRDCLVHLSFDDINKFLQNLSKVNYKYLLTTSHVLRNDFSNEDITSGDFRLINLFSHPFCFDEANILDRVSDYPTGHTPREMILVEKRFVPLKLVLKKS